ncbi:Protein of unknown function [Cellulomonas sp. KH9]|nr:Protein of unknown function [Cellulomonas sp. KH9]
MLTIRDAGTAFVAALTLFAGTVAGPTPAAASPQPRAAAASASTSTSTSKYVPLPPHRILDTREGGAAAPAARSTLDLQVAGVGGVPGGAATAVTLNVTVTQPRQVGFVQVLPTGSGELGASSNLNVYRTDQTVSNLVTVPIGEDGKVTLFNVVGGHLIADVQGYFTGVDNSAEGRYTALTPTRVLDSRDRTGMPPIPPPPGPTNPGDVVNCGNFATWAAANEWFWRYYDSFGDVAKLDGNGDLIPCESLPGAPNHPVRLPPPATPSHDPHPRPAPGETITLPVAGRAGVPAVGASAVAMTVTATDSAGPGFVQVVPTSGPTSLGSTSNVNLTAAGQTVANLVIVPVGSDGSVQLYNSSGTDVIADVVGYFTGPTAGTSTEGLFVPVTPGRLADTRQSPGEALAGGTQLTVDPQGRTGLPASGVSAVFLNVTATDTAAAGYLQVMPTGRATPGSASSVNFTGAGQTTATSTIGTLGDHGQLSVHTPTTAHVILDVSGYFTGAGYTPPPATHPALQSLTVAPQSDGGVAYDRRAWEHWIDADGDCQDTRHEVLAAESLVPVTYDGPGCNVTSGRWADPYSGQTWTVPSDVDIDHMVPLANAHKSGGWAWDAATRRAYANDLAYAGHLIAVEDNLNQSKSSRGPEEWKPPATSYWCTYATDWATIKTTWSLTVTSAEYDALAEMLATC